MSATSRAQAAAEGYAAASGKLGVCIATSGPGATNLITALADANMDSVPMLAITGQQASSLLGTDAFQEADIVGMTMPVTKHSFLVTRAEDIPGVLVNAHHIATTGRPGPVLVDITKDAQTGTAPFVWPEEPALPGYRPILKPHAKQIREAARMMSEAQRPVFYIGGGVIRSEAEKELLRLAEATNIPVVTTLMARGAFPDSHQLHLGMPGMHGSVPAVTAFQKADLLIAIGARFDDRVTGKLDSFAPNAQVIHADIDPAEIGKNREVDVAIVGDARGTRRDAREMRSKFPRPWNVSASRGGASSTASRDLPARLWDARRTVRSAVRHLRISLSPAPSGLCRGRGTAPDVGGAVHRFERPKSWLNSGGLGTMGYSVPAAMGAKVGQPDRVVWAIDGDGCFQMTNQELATCALNNIPIKVAIINNSSLGMVRQWQTLFYDGRYSNTDLNTGHETIRIPDFTKLAEAYGCEALRVDRNEDVDAAIEKALSINDRPVVLDFTVPPDAMVWPMVAAGVSNDEIEYARGIRPEFDGEGEEEAEAAIAEAGANEDGTVRSVAQIEGGLE